MARRDIVSFWMQTSLRSLILEQIQDRSVKGPADLFILKSALQPAEDGGVVAADIEDLVALQVKVAVEGLGEHFIRSYLIAKKR
jgi:hypothetical protein